MTNKSKSKTLYRILHYVLAFFVTWLHVFHLSPALWRQGSSSAFDINVFFWIVLLLWLAFLILPPAIKAHGWWKEFRKA